MRWKKLSSILTLPLISFVYNCCIFIIRGVKIFWINVLRTSVWLKTESVLNKCVENFQSIVKAGMVKLQF